MLEAGLRLGGRACDIAQHRWDAGGTCAAWEGERAPLTTAACPWFGWQPAGALAQETYWPPQQPPALHPPCSRSRQEHGSGGAPCQPGCCCAHVPRPGLHSPRTRASLANSLLSGLRWTMILVPVLTPEASATSNTPELRHTGKGKPDTHMAAGRSPIGRPLTANTQRGQPECCCRPGRAPRPPSLCQRHWPLRVGGGLTQNRPKETAGPPWGTAGPKCS